MKILKALCIGVILSSMMLPSMADTSDRPQSQSETKTNNINAGINDATASVVKDIVDKGSAALGEVASKIESHAPQAWNLVVKGVWAQAAANLVIGLICGLSAALCWSLCFYNIRSTKNDDDCLHIFSAIIFGIMATAGSLSMAWHALDSDVWAAFLSPDGYLAKQIVLKAVGG